jgi:hypothetical protein
MRCLRAVMTTLERSADQRSEVLMRAAVVTALNGPDAVKLLEMPEPEGT